MQRLLPGPPAEVTVEEAYASPLGTGDGRPWVGVCMVASIDGSTVVDGDSSKLSGDTDSAVLHRLRALAQVIVVGAGTVRGEGYGPPRHDQRIGVVTGSGSLDLTTPLFASGAGFVLTTTDADFDVPEGVDVLRAGAGTVDLRAAIGRLDEVCPGVEFVQVEGGPELNGAMLDHDLFDELNVTTSPQTVGGDGPRLATGAAAHLQRFELAQLAVGDDAFVFARWRRKH